jgi:hypothetical protein
VGRGILFPPANAGRADGEDFAPRLAVAHGDAGRTESSTPGFSSGPQHGSQSVISADVRARTSPLDESMSRRWVTGLFLLSLTSLTVNTSRALSGYARYFASGTQ